MSKNIENWIKVTNELIGDNAEMFIISSDNITVSKFEFGEPSDLPIHSHDSEQITVVIEGEMIIKYGTVEKRMGKGDTCIIESNISHSAKIVITPFQSLDIFYPKREDFIKKVNTIK